MTARIHEVTEYLAICGECGCMYGDTMHTRREAECFISDYPACMECEVLDE